METLVLGSFAVCGLFTVALGLVHFRMPWLFDFDGAIPPEGLPLEPLELPAFTYRTTRADVPVSHRS
jgi:hypothetical protein